MTRPKVDPDKRQRTAQACDSCKRRKQKCRRKLCSHQEIDMCNGVKPCVTCVKRRLDCLYTPPNADQAAMLQESVASPTKRRHLGSSPRELKPDLDTGQSSSGHNDTLMPWTTNPSTDVLPKTEETLEAGHAEIPTAICHHNMATHAHDPDYESLHSKISNVNATTDDAALWHSRMLQDSTGRLLFVGDSASLAYLQLIRMTVETVDGASLFTVDPQRHMIMENSIQLPVDHHLSRSMPNQKMADILVDSFFTNTIGFVEVFDRQSFLDSVKEFYVDPLNVHPSMPCLLRLVLAIGLMAFRPVPGSQEEAVMSRLLSDRVRRAEMFFRAAKELADPMSGFEDADFWSIQALLLMSLYTLFVSKRNASYAILGHAVRTAFGLGLHREESFQVIVNEGHCRVRRNLWRSLFVLDRFLSACLGRPAAISDEDCSAHALEPWTPREPTEQTTIPDGVESTSSETLASTVQTSRVIGATLTKIYDRRKFSANTTSEILEGLKEWDNRLPPNLRWRQMMKAPVGVIQGNAALHTNLLCCHAVILLTRPFFLWILTKACEGSTGDRPPRAVAKMDRFAQTCVEASQHTLVLAKSAATANWLPRCNPFVIHFVFAAALIVLSNEFAGLYHNPDAHESINTAIEILKFCSEEDPQADRVLYIVRTFHGANMNRPPNAKKLYVPGREIPTIPTLSRNNDYDPMVAFFGSTMGDVEPSQVKHNKQHQQHRHQHQHQHQHPHQLHQHQHLPTLAPSMKGRPLMLSTAHSHNAGAAMSGTGMPANMQYPSPEGIAGGMDALSGGESEFDFDSLWPFTTPTTTTMGEHPAHRMVESVPGTTGTYEVYDMPDSSSGVGSVTNMAHIPMYPVTGYR